MIPKNIDLHLWQTRDGRWRCRMDHAGGRHRTPAHPTAMGAATAALERLAEQAGVLNVERRRTAAQEPRAQCPRCGAWVDDFDGFGVVAHVKPGHPDGCGYCTHPSIEAGACTLCGATDEEGSHAA